MAKNALILIALVFVVFWPVLQADFINLDDDGHILNNTALHDLSSHSIKQIFTQAPNNTYIPLTILSFAIEKSVFGLNPFVLHLDNLLLYAGVVVLILFLARRMGLSIEASFWASLIFAIHPMRVESVAWLTERKDVLYALFYLLALHQYWSYLKNSSNRNYLFTIFWAILSVLAKPMALSLPLILLLLDWFKGRGWNRRVLLEKIPIVILLSGIAGISYVLNMRHQLGDIFPQGALIWVWSLGFYLWKFIFPFYVYPYYELPHPVSFFYWPYFLSVALITVLILLLARFHRHKLLVFAFLYFICSIFFLLRFDERDFSVVADRFMFLPSLGICLLFGSWVEQRIKNKAGRIILCILLVLLGIKTNSQCRVWHDSIRFWNEIIQEYPNYYRAYNNRGITYYQQERDDLALNDFSRAITLNPKAAKAYNNRGIIYHLKGEDAKAWEDFGQAIAIDPNLPEPYLNRSQLKKF